MAITRRQFLKAAGAAIAAPQVLKAAAGASPPNIVFILADDLGYKDLSFMGSRYYETPNINKLASQGIVFTSAYSNGPNCAPTRASLLSGQYTPRHGIYTVGNSDRGKSQNRKLIPIATETILKPSVVTFGEVLKSAGYATASMGKWHMGDDPKYGPNAQGFDVNVGGTAAGHPPTYFSPYRNPRLSNGPEGEYLTDRLTDEAVKFITANRNRPFLLYLPHFAVHTPIQAKKELTAKYTAKPAHNGQSNAKYAAMIESLDSGVGRLMACLDELGLADNTIVVFFSDNGGVKGITSMDPLRGGKGMLYEGGVRVPLVVRWPGVVKPGSKCDEPVMGIDFYPTLLEIVGAEKPANQPLDGMSLMPLLKGGRSLVRSAIYWHFPAYLQGKAAGARDAVFRTRPAGSIRQGPWKLIEYFEDHHIELYNLDDDISESRNLASDKPEKTAELHRLLIKWRKEINAPVPTKLNPDYKPTA